MPDPDSSRSPCTPPDLSWTACSVLFHKPALGTHSRLYCPSLFPHSRCSPPGQNPYCISFIIYRQNFVMMLILRGGAATTQCDACQICLVPEAAACKARFKPCADFRSAKNEPFHWFIWQTSTSGAFLREWLREWRCCGCIPPLCDNYPGGVGPFVQTKVKKNQGGNGTPFFRKFISFCNQIVLYFLPGGQAFMEEPLFCHSALSRKAQAQDSTLPVTGDGGSVCGENTVKSLAHLSWH